MTERAWTLHLMGGFELRTPDGLIVEVANRKVQALIAILALNQETGIARDDLEEILWPELTPSKRSNNLRQTLLRARNLLGSDEIVASRAHCKFRTGFEIHADLDEDPSSDLVFMPGFEGDWFESMRNHGRSHQPVLASFVGLLDWLSDNDPARMLGMMRENLGLTIGINLRDRLRLLRKSTGDRELAGWRAFFLAGILEGGYTAAAERYRFVLAAAEANGDRLLAVQAMAQLCICAMMTNRFAEAEEYAHLASSLAASTSDPAIIPTATQINGMALIYRGRPAEGLPLLEKAEQQYPVSIDSVIIQALRAFYLSTYGRLTEADRCLEVPRKIAAETGHASLQLVCGLADSAILAHDAGALDAIDRLKRLARLADIHEDSRHTVVANEELAKAYLRTGDIPLAKERAVQAKRLRKSMAMAYTPWDQMRLSKVL